MSDPTEPPSFKTIEGKSERVVKYDTMFFWYVPLMAVVVTLIGLAGIGWDFRALFFLFPGAGLGFVLGISRFRNIP